ncbi:50S ribosomal protein L15 [candidate division KSB3 bacterium]|uniref:Large ribosomal subunit protein uL15 n=1 Tax=candidate division KSB3 bacterium TaxID=2044937 RepID=A0A9D5Q6N6_9BACT|nr:50S ribosomal protein L15 [candidate division KSB3 bacterium]
MKLHKLTYAEGAKPKKKRVGRGPGSGHGKTCGKGHKGQKSRSGSGIHPWSEGGQMPLQRRLPKRGFTNIFKKDFELVNLNRLEEKFDEGTEITIDRLKQANLISTLKKPVKVLAKGDVTKAFHVHAHAFSQNAIEKIKAAGGDITIDT